MVYLDKAKYRVCSITKLGVVDELLTTNQLNLTEGLALEYRTSKNCYIVLGFIKYNKKEESCYFEAVGNRLTEYIETGEDWLRCRSLIYSASVLVSAANEDF